MSLEALVSKYIASTEKVLKEMQRTKGSTSVAEKCVDNILGYVTAYLKMRSIIRIRKGLKQV